MKKAKFTNFAYSFGNIISKTLNNKEKILYRIGILPNNCLSVKRISEDEYEVEKIC